MGFIPSNKISRIKVLGVRAAFESKLVYTENSTLYSILIEFTDGRRELHEVETKKMEKYLPYIDMDY